MAAFLKYAYCSLVLAASGTAMLYAQTDHPPKPPNCLAIRVKLNGKPLPSPEQITVKTASGESSIPAKDGCFGVPDNALAATTVDVMFDVSGNNIHLAAISTRFFAGPWDVYLADHHFAKDIVAAKAGDVRGMCAVVFHVGEPETVLTESNCRRSSFAHP